MTKAESPIIQPKYEARFVELAEKFFLYNQEATLKDLADFLGCGDRSIYVWKNQYPQFADAIWRGQKLAKVNVANAMYQRAMGAKTKEQKAVTLRNADGSSELEIVELEKEHAPDTLAGSFLLRNWSKGRYQDRIERVHVSDQPSLTEMAQEAARRFGKALAQQLLEARGYSGSLIESTAEEVEAEAEEA